jgi:hypothetical protein
LFKSLEFIVDGRLAAKYFQIAKCLYLTMMIVCRVQMATNDDLLEDWRDSPGRNAIENGDIKGRIVFEQPVNAESILVGVKLIAWVEYRVYVALRIEPGRFQVTRLKTEFELNDFVEALEGVHQRYGLENQSLSDRVRKALGKASRHLDGWLKQLQDDVLTNNDMGVWRLHTPWRPSNDLQDRIEEILRVPIIKKIGPGQVKQWLTKEREKLLGTTDFNPGSQIAKKIKSLLDFVPDERQVQEYITIVHEWIAIELRDVTRSLMAELDLMEDWRESSDRRRIPGAINIEGKLDGDGILVANLFLLLYKIRLVRRIEPGKFKVTELTGPLDYKSYLEIWKQYWDYFQQVDQYLLEKVQGAFLEENNYMSVHLQTLQYQVSRNRKQGKSPFETHDNPVDLESIIDGILLIPVFRRLGPDEVLKWVRTESEQLLGTQNAEAGPETLDRMAHLFEFAPSEKDVQDYTTTVRNWIGINLKVLAINLDKDPSIAELVGSRPK